MSYLSGIVITSQTAVRSKNRRSQGIKNSQAGQSLIEALLGLGILLILFHSLASLLITSYEILGNTRTRTAARYLATERMEEARNLPYVNVGVVGGIPPGDLPQLETVPRNGLDYIVRTSVVYIDDPFDNLAPTDPYPTDYKRIRVDVSWTGRFTVGDTVTMISDIASDEITSGGTLSILVFDAEALPVDDADVSIINTDADPDVNLNLKTDEYGRIVIPGAPPCDNNCYKITVTKPGYNADRTYGTEEVENPDKPHANVADGGLTDISFSIDILGTIQFSSYKDRTFNFAIHGYKTFDLKGNQLGTDIAGDPVYKHDQWHQTNAAGTLTLPDMHYGNYLIAMPGGDTWDLSGSSPYRPLYVAPGVVTEIGFTVTPDQLHTLLVLVKDASGSAVASASARLQSATYNKTVFTGFEDDPDFGHSFFSPLQFGSYTLDVSLPGYEPTTDTLSVSDDTEFTVILNEL